MTMQAQLPADRQHRQEDYLQIPNKSISSFHFRTGKVPWLPVTVAPNNPSSLAGFPTPGPQAPTPAFATAKHYFVDDGTWERIIDHGEFDDIVVGSGFCALAYVDAALKKDPWRKILILERGGFWLPEHFQNMPLPFKLVLGGPSETFPFTLTSKTSKSEDKFMHGSCPFFGGRSTFWSAWCPRAVQDDHDLMRNFPKSMKETVAQPGFWKRCEDLLHVTTADKLSDPCFGKGLQKDIQGRLDAAVRAGAIKSAYLTRNAPLAVGRKTAVPNATAFDKFSTPGPLLRVFERQRQLAKEGRGHPLMIATDTIVERFVLDEDSARPSVLYTSRGALCFPKEQTNIILAAGTFPAATILMNSVGDRLKGRAGARVGGHFISHVTARFPVSALADNCKLLEHLEISANYLAGRDETTKMQYHVQITAIHSPDPEEDAVDAARLCPDYAAAATAEQLRDSTKHIVLVCATLGELDELNKDSWLKHDPANPDVTTNVRLQVLQNERSRELRNIMEEATYRAIEVMAGSTEQKPVSVDYWHDDVECTVPLGPLNAATVVMQGAGWKKARPPTSMIRVPGLVHETSTLYVSDDLESDPHAALDSQYRPRGTKGVYVTGGAIFPTSGSWNPTLTMCGFAQHLADQLYTEKQARGGGHDLK